MFFYHLFGTCSALRDYIQYLSVDLSTHLFGIWAQVLGISKADVPDFIVHSQFGNDTVCDFIGFLEIISCSIGRGTKEIFLGASAAQNEADLVDELRFGVEFVLVIEILGEAKWSFRTGNDGQF